MKAYCLFEQSGTFKNEFIKLGIEAYDIDMCSDFHQTDILTDLFQEIDDCYNSKESIFDNITPDDIVLAFFPCTYFQENNSLFFKGLNYSQKKWDDHSKLQYCINRHNALNDVYKYLCELFIIALNKGFKLIVENPYTQPHYLTNYFPIKPSIIDSDRRDMGDYFKKPTQYWFINCKPKYNFIFEPKIINPTWNVEKAHKIKNGYSRQVNRSIISAAYANRFIREMIL